MRRPKRLAERVGGFSRQAAFNSTLTAMRSPTTSRGVRRLPSEGRRAPNIPQPASRAPWTRSPPGAELAALGEGALDLEGTVPDLIGHGEYLVDEAAVVVDALLVGVRAGREAHLDLDDAARPTEASFDHRVDSEQQLGLLEANSDS